MDKIEALIEIARAPKGETRGEQCERCQRTVMMLLNINDAGHKRSKGVCIDCIAADLYDFVKEVDDAQTLAANASTESHAP